MEVLFLGTSSGWPLPRLGCKCRICSSEDPKDTRFRPSLLVNQTVLLDAPLDIYSELKRYRVNPALIDQILITHSHDDHILGLNDLTKIYGRKQKISLIATKGVLAQMRRLVSMAMAQFTIFEAKPLEKISFGQDTFAWFVPVEHGKIETYALKIKAPKPIVYAPEFRRIPPSSRGPLGDLDLTILDGSNKSVRGQAKGHETIEEGLRLGRDIKAKRVLFTNIGHKTDIHRDLELFVKREGGEKFAIAFDGLEVKL